MGTAFHYLRPEGANFLGSTYPQRDKKNGTNIPVSVLWYDSATDEAAFWRIVATSYLSGNLTLDILWYADTATSGVIRWGASIAAITPDADTQDIETDALTTEEIFDDTHLGTTGQRLHKATITLTNLDSIAAGDEVTIRIRRVGSNAADTMTGDAGLVQAVLSYGT